MRCFFFGFLNVDKIFWCFGRSLAEFFRFVKITVEQLTCNFHRVTTNKWSIMNWVFAIELVDTVLALIKSN